MIKTTNLVFAAVRNETCGWSFQHNQRLQQEDINATHRRVNLVECTRWQDAWSADQREDVCQRGDVPVRGTRSV